MTQIVDRLVMARLKPCPNRGTLRPMAGELMALIQEHLDKYGVKRAEFARRAGTTPQTVQNWIDRPTTLPRREHLEGVANVIGVPYAVVLAAALKDAGYQDDGLPMAARTEDHPNPR